MKFSGQNDRVPNKEAEKKFEKTLTLSEVIISTEGKNDAFDFDINLLKSVDRSKSYHLFNCKDEGLVNILVNDKFIRNILQKAIKSGLPQRNNETEQQILECFASYQRKKKVIFNMLKMSNKQFILRFNYIYRSLPNGRELSN